MDNHDLDLYWKTVVDTIQEGVMIVNPEGVIISINQAFEEITGYRQDEILGRPCSTLNCSSCELVRNEVSCHWCVMFKRGQLKKQKCSLIRKDGQAVNILKNASVLKDRKGEVIGAVETITDITDLIEKEAQIEIYKKELDSEDRFHGIIGISASMQHMFELIENAAQSDAPVIIYGESGTGKELAARAIHKAGVRKKGPYIKVNCASLNESLLESELFGHVKGAFTGAHRSREGRFEASAGGDIFLDEIGDLPLSTQVKLLRVLEEKVVERVGDQQPIKVDVRIISATNRDLADLIRKGKFREDFFYRINVIPIKIPPLRERLEDIPLLAQSFFNRISLKSSKKIQGISNQALDLLMKYHWPGNVRELKSAFEFAFVSCKSSMISPEHLPGTIVSPGALSMPREEIPDIADIKNSA
ncbi:PAS modulated sigma54-dependent transcriptional regulator, Fis family [Desulfonema limicola]|uniref:PAS modulated sigma54-dependent transcriptional regulator, Fis family n=1 Tax=Desulfonema limicola TaxID=45656 RepID=A0A975B5U1_9BACT|nr:PAS modulated sigma54-dependent transcriptional regulator, Fis family [Desulfonema limicola]